MRPEGFESKKRIRACEFTIRKYEESADFGAFLEVKFLYANSQFGSFNPQVGYKVGFGITVNIASKRCATSECCVSLYPNKSLVSLVSGYARAILK